MTFNERKNVINSIQKVEEGENFETLPSSIPNGGLGVYSKKHIPGKGVVLMRYTGSTITGRLDKHFTGDSSKYVTCYSKKRKQYIDASDPEASGMARYINTHNDHSKFNSRFSIALGCILISSTREIMPGEEIFIDYGR
jgi:hypothetical protein